MFRNSEFLGIDINEGFKEYFDNCESNVAFEVGDIYKLDKKYANQFDGVICLQTLSWLPDYKEHLLSKFVV
ncbi:MAG: class I SAM-dependent methyltransferase [Ruminococcus flavefaciens]|nr:class I SAM-dependent methyltransferase [Ruminococcus flavefaciens]